MCPLLRLMWAQAYNKLSSHPTVTSTDVSNTHSWYTLQFLTRKFRTSNQVGLSSRQTFYRL